jgi:hypothetical protein
MTFSGGSLWLKDSAGERDHIAISNTLRILGGAVPAPPLHVADVRPSRGTAGTTLHLDEVVGSHFEPNAVIHLSNIDRQLPASHVSYIDDNTLTAVIPTGEADEGVWDLTVVGEGGSETLPGAFTLGAEGGGQGEATLLQDPDLDVDYIIITPDASWDASVAPLINYRQGQGHSVLRARIVEEIRPEFGPGPDTTLVKEFLQYAFENFRSLPQFVLLVGDSVDPQYAGTNIFPSLQRGHHAYGADNTFPYDDGYVTMDNDLIPDYILGRLPARSPAEMTAYVSKLIAYEATAPSENWPRHMSILVGDRHSDPENVWITALATEILNLVPEGQTSHIAYAHDFAWNDPALEQYVKNEFHAGRLVIDAYGNTTNEYNLAYFLEFNCSNPNSPTCFAVSELGNAPMYPVLFTTTCLASSFDDPMDGSYRSISERFLFSGNRGIIGAIGPTHTAFLHEVHPLDVELYKVLPKARDLTLGQMAWVAKEALFTRNLAALDAAKQTAMLGEPVLKLAWSPASSVFRSAMELSEKIPWQNKLYSAPVNMGEGATLRIVEEDNDVDVLQGRRMIRLLGEDLGSADSKVEFNAYNMDFLITSNSFLSYWVLAEDSPPSPNDHGHVGVDLVSLLPLPVCRMESMPFLVEK